MRHRKVADVMTTEVATAREGTTFKEIVAMLHLRDVSGVPVLDVDDRVVGIVTQADLLPKQGAQEPVRARSGWDRLPRPRSRDRAQATTAAGLMATPVITIGPDATVVEAARSLYGHGIKRLPVVDTDGRLIGIVSRRDLLSVFLRTDEEIAREITREVFGRNLGIPVGPDTVIVQVRRGMVTLRGELDRRSTIPIAERLSAQVDGVIDVRSHLTYALDDTSIRIPDSMTVDITHEPERI
ncbi:MAG TPA: CBS domain-containing protein [Actinophytocola sp.]|uniref:CBS domain-containing protein n=1 Tax=Actinophytocola sp. TaxID=1872138 RepID=UPI002DBB8AA9|nr:CBS domain-containing protein [Actinophytocola sp.]HEU5475544.1 CBS domain-containing protein [Actinophytocola sp.]